MSQTRAIAVIGAGMCGLTCAHALAEAGLPVRVFEKSRGIGGRMATRRAEGLAFDHGAQFMTARGAPFAEWLDGAVARGEAADWTPRGLPAGQRRIVGVPKMTAPLRHLADGLEVSLNAGVAAVVPEDDGLRLALADGTRTGIFARVVCTAPAPQAARLLAADAALADALARVAIAPCWTLMVAFDTAPGLPDAAEEPGEGIAFLAQSGTRPGRPDAPAWVMHATPEWSAAHLELDPDAARERMLELLGTLAPLPRPAFAATHRWRHARTTAPLGRPCAASADGRMLAGGDWTLDARIEAAFDSGKALAQAVVGGI
ncbi:FAD-dependent oxidoreductase [Rhodobacteraceae bacterium 2CG4]|uniref:FAD-dependent oxidoreductase n=1 Tax=Halovulum marinum TaxID=2662447 RepID=A0A6L5Z252_9RHOB|nr:FAD-dependent oxidoreductase [Halovulum marinum]MSU90155.1 FAD-dependent oxidoreductase [Halovulum marinum]